MFQKQNEVLFTICLSNSRRCAGAGTTQLGRSGLGLGASDVVELHTDNPSDIQFSPQSIQHINTRTSTCHIYHVRTSLKVL